MLNLATFILVVLTASCLVAEVNAIEKSPGGSERGVLRARSLGRNLLQERLLCDNVVTECFFTHDMCPGHCRCGYQYGEKVVCFDPMPCNNILTECQDTAEDCPSNCSCGYIYDLQSQVTVCYNDI